VRNNFQTTGKENWREGRGASPVLDYHYHEQERFLTNNYSAAALPWVAPTASKAFARCSGLL
jgi:hypothetical protein